MDDQRRDEVRFMISLAARLKWTGRIMTEIWDELRARHHERHRHYHTLRHVLDCLNWLEQALEDGVPATDRNALELAIWFHDAVYDPEARDNVEQSIRLFRTEATRRNAWTEDFLQKVESLILVTKHDRPPQSPDERLIVDIDLAILGAPRRDYRLYADLIRLEYAWVPTEQYRTRRIRVLRRFLDRDSIYSTEYFRGRLETKARANLKWEIVCLSQAD